MSVLGASENLGTNNEILKICGSNPDDATVPDNYLGLGVDSNNDKCWIRSYNASAESHLIIQNEGGAGFLGVGKLIPEAKLHVGGDTIVDGSLTVHGTTTTVNSTTVTVDDHNIELGSVATPTDLTAENGGITLKGATDKEFKWGATADAWRSNVNLQVLHSARPKIDLIRTSVGGAVDGIELISSGDTTLSPPVNNRGGLIELTTPVVGTEGAILQFSTRNGTTKYETLKLKDGLVTVKDKIEDDAGVSFVKTSENISTFNNDSAYITASDIPTDISAFTNDSAYITLAQVPLPGNATTSAAGIVKISSTGGLAVDTDGTLSIANYNSNYADGALFTSDEKLKSNISKIQSPISIAKAIEGVRFEWNDKSEYTLRGKEDIGLIAQNVEKVLPEAVSSNSNSELSVYYHKLVPVLLECIKDQQDQIDSLGKRISDLEK